MALDPKFTDALHGFAQAYYAQEDFDNAIAAWPVLDAGASDILAWITN